MGFLYFCIVLLAIGYAAAVQLDQSDTMLVVEVSCDDEQWTDTRYIVMTTLEAMNNMAKPATIRSNRVALVLYGCTKLTKIDFNAGYNLHTLYHIWRGLNEIVIDVGASDHHPDDPLLYAYFMIEMSPDYKTLIFIWLPQPIQKYAMYSFTKVMLQQGMADPITPKTMIVIVCSGQLAKRHARDDADADYTFDIGGQDNVVSTEFLIDADYDPNNTTIFTRLLQLKFGSLILTKACVEISYDECGLGQCGVGYTQSSTSCDIYFGNTMTKIMEYRVWELCCLTPCPSNNSGNGTRPQWLCRDLPPYN